MNVRAFLVAVAVTATPLPSFALVDADTVDGLHASAFQLKAGGIVVVSRQGGDTSDLAAAVAAAGSSGTVLIDGGDYVLNAPLEVRGKVIGMGRLRTTISRSIASGDPQPWVVRVLGGGELTDVSVYAQGTGGTAVKVEQSPYTNAETRVERVFALSNAIGFDVTGTAGNPGGGAAVKNCIALATGGGEVVGVRMSGGRLVDSYVDASGPSGAALRASGWTSVSRTMLLADPSSSPDANLASLDVTGGPGVVALRDVEFEVNPAVGSWNLIRVIRNRGGNVLVENSSFNATSGTVPPTSISNDSGTLRILNSSLNGGITNAGTLRCLGNYDGPTLSPVACPP